MVAVFYDVKNNCEVRSDQLVKVSYTTNELCYKKTKRGPKSSISCVEKFTTGDNLVLLRVENTTHKRRKGSRIR